jgi:hypothetical protein
MNIEEITFGIEIECLMPIAEIAEKNIHIGGYGMTQAWMLPASTGCPQDSNGSPIFGIGYDSSLQMLRQSDHGTFKTVEIVSNVLKGTDGILQALNLFKWLTKMGCKVNRSCGLHIHIGIASVVNGGTPDDAINFVTRTLQVAKFYETSLYSQTGTLRDESQWCLPIRSDTTSQFKNFRKTLKGKTACDLREFSSTCRSTQRYSSVNLRNHGNGKNTIEFRAFAGTLNFLKVQYHLMTVFALVAKGWKTRDESDQYWTPSEFNLNKKIRQNPMALLEFFHKYIDKEVKDWTPFRTNRLKAKKLAVAMTAKYYLRKNPNGIHAETARETYAAYGEA